MYLVNPPHYNESTPFDPSPSVERAWICRLHNYGLQPIVIHQPHNSHCYRIQYVSRFSFEFVSLKVGDTVVTLGLLLWKTLLGDILSMNSNSSLSYAVKKVQTPGAPP